MDPLPPINKVFALMVQQERQLLSECTEESRVLAVSNFVQPTGNVVSSNSSMTKKGGKGKSGKGGKLCSFCGKSGHTVDTCFKKHGFPPHYKKGQGAAVNNITSDASEIEDNSVEEAQTVPNLGLTKEQYQ